MTIRFEKVGTLAGRSVLVVYQDDKVVGELKIEDPGEFMQVLHYGDYTWNLYDDVFSFQSHTIKEIKPKQSRDRSG